MCVPNFRTASAIDSTVARLHKHTHKHCLLYHIIYIYSTEDKYYLRGLAQAANTLHNIYIYIIRTTAVQEMDGRIKRIVEYNNNIHRCTRRPVVVRTYNGMGVRDYRNRT